MTRYTDVDRKLESWLAEGPSQLPDHVIDGIVRQLDETNQRRSTWLPRREEMNRMILAIGGIAAAVALAFVAVGLYFNGPGVAAPPPPTAPPTASPRADPEGELVPGTYVAHPLPAPNDSLTVIFTVPEGWFGLADPGQLTGLMPAGEPGTQSPGGLAIQFIDVTALNGDPCDWSGADDVSVGPEVDDLVEALLEQTAYEVSVPIDVVIGGYSGKRVDIVHPTEPFWGEEDRALECDGERYRIWRTSAHGPDGVYAQGPANRWQANILDVDGTRLVIIAMDFPGTSPGDRAELDAIIGSIAIER